MIDLCHTKRDRKSLQQILQIFIFNIGWGRYEWKKDGDKMSLSKIADDHI